MFVLRSLGAGMGFGLQHDTQGETVSVSVLCHFCKKPIEDVSAAWVISPFKHGFQAVRIVHGGCDPKKDGEFKYELLDFVNDLKREVSG